MTRWGLTVRVLHWIAVLVLLAQLVVVFGLQGPGLAMLVWMPWHMSLGFSLLAITVLRLAVRVYERSGLSAGALAGALQAGLYLVLIAATLTGWFAYRPSPFAPAPHLFGIVSLSPAHLPFGAPWTQLHKALVWLLLALAALHVTAALYHFVVLKDRVVQLMLFGRAPDR